MAGYNIISATQVADRLDAEYYNKVLLENEQKLASFQQITLENAVKNEKNAIADLTSNGSFEFLRGIEFNADSGIPFIRTQNLMDGYIDNQDMLFVSVSSKEKVSKSLCKTGDLVVCRKGKVGSASAISLEMDGAAISENVTRFRLKEDFDADFLSAFLNSKQGRTRFLRESTGVIQKWINNEKLRQIKVVRLNNSVEKYIGDKVRQAGLLREWSKSLRKQIKSYFDNLFAGLNLSSPVQRYGKVSLDNLVPRLNAEYYAEQYLQVEKYLKNKFGVLATIGELSPTVRSKTRPTTDCIYKEIGDLDTATGKFGQGTYYTYFDVPNNAQRVFDAGDVAVSTRRPNRGAIAVVEESSKDIFYSVFLARLKPKNKSFGYWLKEYLRHDAGKLLLLQRCTWTTYPVISEDDLETVPVPKLVDDWEQIAKLSTQSVLLEEYATKLTHVAKKIVEGLIEGTITEDNLVQAQNALEQGDESLDRAILSQMPEDGYAVAGSKPLFSDLDEFYDLLEQAKALE